MHPLQASQQQTPALCPSASAFDPSLQLNISPCISHLSPPAALVTLHGGQTAWWSDSPGTGTPAGRAFLTAACASSLTASAFFTSPCITHQARLAMGIRTRDAWHYVCDGQASFRSCLRAKYPPTSSQSSQQNSGGCKFHHNTLGMTALGWSPLDRLETLLSQPDCHLSRSAVSEQTEGGVRVGRGHAPAAWEASQRGRSARAI